MIFYWNDKDKFDSVDSIDSVDFIEDIEWKRWTPRKSSAPIFGENNKIRVTGITTSIGGYEITVPVTGGKTYRFDVEFHVEHIDDINLHVLNLIRTNINKNNGGNPVDGISNFKKIQTNCGENRIAGSLTLQIHDKADSVSVLLGLRFSDGGTAEWHSIAVSEAEPVQPRKAVIGVTKYHPETLKTLERYIEFTNHICAKATAEKTDLLLFTEFANIYSSNSEDLAEEISPESFTYQLISENAIKYNMYICMPFYEKRGDHFYNTAVLFGRDGKIIGTYSKVHLYWPEELLSGTVPGDEHPVFDLDFGRVGIVICYDNWFAESYRILALKGAELVLCPNAGYEPKLTPARAIDNCVYVAVSSMHHPSTVVNTLGNVIAELDGYNDCDEEKAFAAAEIDLSQRPLPHANAGGNMNGSPGGRRIMRHSRSTKLYEEILKEISEWENRDTVYTWL